MKGIKDRVAFITGGTSGLGAEISRKFAELGAKVVIFAPDVKGGNAIEEELNAISECLFIEGDVRKKEEVDKAVDRTVEKFGTVDFGIHCAGVPGSRHAFTDVPPEVFDFVMDVNVKGVMMCMQAEIKVMEEKGFGRIVNVSSAAAHTSGDRELVNYVISKHALNGLTRNAAVTYADKGISINSLAPGTMLTPFVRDNYPEEAQEVLKNARPTKRFVNVEAIADMAVYMCSDYAADMIGSAIVMDGGRIAQ